VRAGTSHRFNEAFIAFKPKEAELRTQINRSRGRCTKIWTHALKMQRRAKGTDLASVFGLLGIQGKQSQTELADMLQRVYDEDRLFHEVVDQMTIAISVTFREVQRALGPAGQMHPARVPNASKVLGEYARKFLPLESRCNYLAGELQRVIDASGVPLR
jgi:hypothetical protein